MTLGLRRASILSLWLLALAHASPVAAFCIANACAPDVCPETATCSGPDLHWRSGSATIAVDSNASPLRDLSSDQFTDAVSEALSSWRDASCPGGGHPSLDIEESSVQSASVSFVRGGTNQNVVTFFDEDWPYQANAVAKTHLTFDEKSGELEDADIALDSDRFFLALDDLHGDVDVVAVLTHELGHFFGLGHSAVLGATMQAESVGFGTSDLRSLEADDIEAICTLYPPASESTKRASSGCSIVSIARTGSARDSAIATLCLCAWLYLRLQRRITTRSA